MSRKEPKKIEAYGVRGMKSKPWQKTFADVDKMNRWVEENDATIEGTRYVEEDNEHGGD